MTRVAEPQATFSAEEAARAASEAVEERSREQIAQLTQEAEGAKEATREYAEQLAQGGSPTDFPSRRGSDVTLDRVGQAIVYRRWNAARGSRNPVSPFSGPGKWWVAEALFDRFGEPITYADLCAVYRSVSRYSATNPASEEFARLLVGIEQGQETVVGRRTKLDGKVAFFLRDRREGDPEVGAYRHDEIPEEKP